MTDREYINLEKRIRRAAAKEGYTISRRFIPNFGYGYNIIDSNNLICNRGNYEMDLDDVAEWFNVR